eukprot:4418734-Pyramimonas_sp.AAC.1
MIQGKMRPLAPEGCRDAARGEPTVLLVEGGRASDLKPPSEGNATACLCEHHKQIYKVLRYSEKCSQ